MSFVSMLILILGALGVVVLIGMYKINSDKADIKYDSSLVGYYQKRIPVDVYYIVKTEDRFQAFSNIDNRPLNGHLRATQEEAREDVNWEINYYTEKLRKETRPTSASETVWRGGQDVQ